MNTLIVTDIKRYLKIEVKVIYIQTSHIVKHAIIEGLLYIDYVISQIQLFELWHSSIKKVSHVF